MSADTGGSEGGYGQEGPEEPLEIVGRYDAKRLTGDDKIPAPSGLHRSARQCARQMDSEWHGRDMTIQLEASITENPGAVGEYRAHCTSP